MQLNRNACIAAIAVALGLAIGQAASAQEKKLTPLGRNRRPPLVRVEPVKRPIPLRQRFVHQISDLTQRMLRGHPRFNIHVSKQTSCPLIRSAHRDPRFNLTTEPNHALLCLSGVFSSLLA